MTKVTYRILEQGDPIETTFAGFKFRTGEPVEIPDDATMETMERREIKMPDGETRHRTYEGKRSVLEALKGNPYFVVDGATPVAKAKPGRPATPKTPSEYRSYALGWFKTSENAIDLAARWEREAGLREKIGVHEGGEDFAYLSPFFEQRHSELQRAEAA